MLGVTYATSSDLSYIAIFLLSNEIHMRRERSSQERLQLQEVGRRLALVRAALGLTQTTMAAALGVGLNAISSAETGKVELRSPHLSVLADRYQISPLWLLRGLGQIFVMPWAPEEVDVVLNAARPSPAGVRASLSLLAESGMGLWLRVLHFRVARCGVDLRRDPVATAARATTQETIEMVGLGGVDQAGAFYYVTPAVCRLDHLAPELLWVANPVGRTLSGQVHLSGQLQAGFQSGISFTSSKGASSGGEFVAGSLSAVTKVPSPQILLGWLRAHPAPLTELLPLKDQLVEVVGSVPQADEILSAPRPPSAWAHWAFAFAQLRMDML
ncbi:hypothetical protein CLG94_10310 [Candidatus Methylomirabilis limnetica]|uniref:HTH cro/C1-type domain-containing protein n=2 Tax=Candidatus Methylomirabilis limnetica TaxID=2033718 RepID=A0A2T4TW01_9BACT|nr:hypothetical protein CLG94_10310 [Candidatus Methylomirabilis limnetica]